MLNVSRVQWHLIGSWGPDLSRQCRSWSDWPKWISIRDSVNGQIDPIEIALRDETKRRVEMLRNVALRG